MTCICAFLWTQISQLESQFTQQSTQLNAQFIETKFVAKEAIDNAKESSAKLALLSAKVEEVALQRQQLEGLMKSLSETRDKNLIAEIDSLLRLGQQEALLSGSIQPLITALKTAEQRTAQNPQPLATSQPRLILINKAITRDLERIKSKPSLDIPQLLIKMDQLILAVDDIPLASDSPSNANGQKSPLLHDGAKPDFRHNAQADQANSWTQGIRGAWFSQWLQSWLSNVWSEFATLIRISANTTPDANLLSPSQSYFLKENIKLRLLNAKIALYTHQMKAGLVDLNMSEHEFNRYFALKSPQAQTALVLLKEIKELSSQPDIPLIQDTWAAINASSLSH
jgi:uroporphyrin-3 C-methyltransferase